MAKVELNSLLKAVRGRIGNAVLRLSHTGEVILTKSPDMSKVKWSEAQLAHRIRMMEAVHYAKMAVDIPELRAYYLEMAHRIKNNNRPFDMAVSDYMKGNNRLVETIAPRTPAGLAPSHPHNDQPDFSI